MLKHRQFFMTHPVSTSRGKSLQHLAYEISDFLISYMDIQWFLSSDLPLDLHDNQGKGHWPIFWHFYNFNSFYARFPRFSLFLKIWYYCLLFMWKSLTPFWNFVIVYNSNDFEWCWLNSGVGGVVRLSIIHRIFLNFLADTMTLQGWITTEINVLFSLFHHQGHFLQDGSLENSEFQRKYA